MKKKLLAFAIALIIAIPLFAQDTLLQSTLRKHVDILAADTLEGRGEGSNGIIKARKYIINEFEKAGIKPYQGKYEYDFSFKVGVVRAQSQNIIACIEGSDSSLKHEYIIIGAHYDHIGWDENGKKITYYNGADDNASGTASIIEIAKLLKQNKSSLKRSIIIIAFGAEESGLIGSKHIFTDSIIPANKIKCMFSVDMVGRYRTNKGLTLTGFKTLKNYKELIELAKQKAPINIVKTTNNIETRTDAKSFGDKGIPAVHVFTGFKSKYHTPEDDSNLLDYKGMAAIGKFMSELAMIMANEESVNPSVSFLARTKTKGNFYFAPYFTYGVGTSSNQYPEQFYNAKSIFAVNVGLAAKIALSKRFAIQPEVLYETTGSKSLAGSLRTYGLTVPIQLLVGMDNSADYNAYYIVGFYYKNLFSGKDEKKEMDFSKEYNKIKYGLTFGVGFEYARTQIKLIGNYAITPLYINPALEISYESSIFISFGFGL
jgi:hypothetical protein